MSADISVIESVLAQGRVAVIPGFVARDPLGRVALFGRGGSDLSALFLAKQLNARCRLIKDVDGIYNSDPAANHEAKRFDEINFADALTIAGKVVQRKAIAFGRKTSVSFEVAALGEDNATVVGSHRSVLSPKNFAHRSAEGWAARPRHGWLGSLSGALEASPSVRRHRNRGATARIASHHAPANLLTRDCWDVIDDVDVVVELIGGSDPAGDLVNAALAAGKPVVTANKLLLAGDARLETHRELRYSAAVGGAVPALEAVRALADDGRIVSLSGVLNGTCNYILDRIAAGCSWEQAVTEAQERGFAEADPSADLSGADTVCKLRLLARRAFPQTGTHSISSTGIDAVDHRLGTDGSA